MTMREMVNGDDHNMDDTRGYETPGVPLVCLRLEDLESVLLRAGSGLLRTVSGNVN